MGNLSNTTINGVSYDFKDAGAARQSHSHTKSQITDFPTSMPASDVYSWAKASSKPTYTQDEVGDGTTYKRVTSTEKNTWNNKGTYSKPSGGIPKTDLASAVQTSLGLADKSLQHTTVSGSPDLDTYLTTGVYHIATQTATHAPTTNHATLFVDATVGTPYQIFKPDSSDTVWYARHRSGSAWSTWVAMKFTDTTYSAATTSAAGLMSATDKSKLDGIASGATKTAVDSALSSTSTNPVQNKVINTALAGKASTAVATTSAAGLMSSADKTKLNGIATGAQVNETITEISLSNFISLASGITYDTVGGYPNTSYIYKQGKHIFGYLHLWSQTEPSGSVIGTIKSGYRPAKNILTFAFEGNSNVCIPIPISTDGTISRRFSFQYNSIICIDYVTS